MNELQTIDFEPVDEALFLAGGFGTRAWPGSLITPKEVSLINGIPILERNLTCFEGINHLVIVIGEDKVMEDSGIKFQEALIRRWMFGSPSYEEAISATGKEKAELIERTRAMRRNITVDFVTQPFNSSRGTAQSIAEAENSLGKKFFVTAGDDCLFNGATDFATLQMEMHLTGATHGMLVGTARHQITGKYAGGIVATDENRMLIQILENRPVAEVNQLGLPILARNISKYILDRSIFGPLNEYMRAKPESDEEYYFTTVLERAASLGQRIIVREAEALYLDVGKAKDLTLASARVGLREGNLSLEELQQVIDEFKAIQVAQSST